MFTSETRKAAADIYASAERLRIDAEASIEPILAKVETILDGIEAMLGKPVIGRCEGCGTLIVEGDTYAVDESAGLLICDQLQGTGDGGCLDQAQAEARQLEQEAAHD